MAMVCQFEMQYRRMRVNYPLSAFSKSLRETVPPQFVKFVVVFILFFLNHEFNPSFAIRRLER